MKSPKVVYITGCLGFIGSYVTKACLEMGWHVMGVDKLTYAANRDNLNTFNEYVNFTFLQEDICDLKYLCECDYVINLAAETHVANSINNSSDFIKTNISGLHNLLECIKNYRGESANKPILIHFSTDEVYGDTKDGAHTEGSILNPSNPYSASKAAGDMLILAWNRTYNISYRIIRPTNNYGIGQYVEKLIPRSIKLLKLNRRIPLFNEGKAIRNWLHAADTAEAVLKIIEKGKDGEIYNVAGNCEISNRDIIQKILDNYFGCPTNIENHVIYNYSRPGHDLRYALNDKKLRDLGWEPKQNLDDMIKQIVSYYKSHNYIW